MLGRPCRELVVIYNHMVTFRMMRVDPLATRLFKLRSRSGINLREKARNIYAKTSRQIEIPREEPPPPTHQDPSTPMTYDTRSTTMHRN